MKEKQEITFWATKERKPLVQTVSVALPDGGEIKFKSKNAYKAWRKQAKKDIKKMRKAGR